MTTVTGTQSGSPATRPASVTGVQLMQGVGVQEARGFWAEAWGQVARRATARFAMAWLGVVAFFAVLAPVLANGHPIILWELDRQTGAVTRTWSPMLTFMTAGDVLLLVGTIAGIVWFIAARHLPRSTRLGVILVCALMAGLIAVSMTGVNHQVRAWLQATRDAGQTPAINGTELWVRVAAASAVGLVFAAIFYALVPLKSAMSRLVIVLTVAAAAGAAGAVFWTTPLTTFPYRDMIQMKRAEAVFTVIPFSPNQRSVTAGLLRPGQSTDQTKDDAGPPTPGQPRHFMGTDSLGQDVLSQVLHACRLSISIGLVSTGIAVIIGVTIGALMGYFGGWVDLLLYRVVEIFMAVPVLFLLIVAAAVLPKSTYVMMAIIGCVTWTGAARFTRAEFMKLRDQDFVQAARAMGLPLRSVLFKHMLPNGVTPVLVDASFAIAAAILAEATLSYLKLGPEEQASWGRLLADSTNNVGDFLWWLAIFPGLAIFLSVLSYNLLGESLRDAIDPKLKKARV